MKKELKIKDLNPIYDLDLRSSTNFQPNHFFGDKRFYNIDFDVILDNGTKLQRDYVWTLEQKQKLIISMLCGMQLPPIYCIVFEDDINVGGYRSDKVYKIIDGKQRLSTIRDFMENKFPITANNSEYYYSDLDNSRDFLKYKIDTYSLDFRIVYEYPDAKLGDEKYVKLFNYVNFGGTPQEKEHMDNLLESLKK